MTAAPPQVYPFVPTNPVKRSAPSWWSRQVKLRIAVTGPPGDVRIIVTWVSAVLALVTLWFVFFATVLSALQEGHNQHNAYAAFREQLTQLAPKTAPLGGVITPDAPVALINAPSLGLKNVVIVEGTAAGDLTRGPGHQRNTPLPGQAGVSVVLGRATLYGGVFSQLSQAKPGDPITVTTGQGEARYQVEDVRHVGDPFPPQLKNGEGQLTLISAEGGHWYNGWRPARPLYLDAKLQGSAFPNPGGGLSVVPQAEKPMHGDPGVLFSLVLWLPLLTLAGVLVVWLQQRWGRWQAWLIGAPVALAALWGVSETAAQLLPNLM